MGHSVGSQVCPGCPLPHPEAVEAPWRRHEPGETLVEQGELRGEVLRVREGVVLVSAVDRDGEETLCALRGPGACLNLNAILKRPSTTRAEALGPVLVCHLSVELLSEALDAGGEPAHALATLLLDDTRAIIEGQRHAVGRRAGARLASLLLEMDGLGLSPADVPRGLLARLLRIRPETLSRLVQGVRDAGLVGPGLNLLDRGGLERWHRE